MIKEKYRNYFHWGMTAAIVLCIAIAFYFLLLRWGGFTTGFHDLSSILAPVSCGLIIAYILDSLVNTIMNGLARIPWHFPVGKKRMKVRKTLVIGFTILLVLLLLFLLAETVIPQLIDSIRTLISNFDIYVQSLEQWIQPFLAENPTLEQYVTDQINNAENVITDFLKNDLLTLMTRLTSGIVEVGTSVYNILLGLIVSVYLLSSKERIIGHAKKLIYTGIKTSYANKIMSVSRQTNKMFKGFLVGKLLDSTIIGILCFIGTMLFGIPYALLVSIVVGVTNIIPYFGPFIGAIPSALLILMVNPSKCLIFLIFILVLQQIDGNVIGPKILGNTTGVSSLGVLISILIGGGLFGVAGMVLAVPTFGVLYSLIKQMAERRLEKKGLPTDTSVYLQLEQADPVTREVTLLNVQKGESSGIIKNLLKRKNKNQNN